MRRVIARASMGGMVALAVIVAVLLLGVFPAFGTGHDERMYREATLRWLGGGAFYLPHQLAAPYTAQLGDVLYPPPMLLLFVPLSLLPAPVWYVIPTALIAWSLYRMRPAWWAWPVLLVIAAWPWTLGFFLFGNPKMWLLAGAFVLFALGWRWWIVAGIAGVIASLAFLPMWPDYLTALRNARSMEYQAATVALVTLPLVASVASRAHDPQRERVFRRRRPPQPQGAEAVRVAHGDGVEVVGR